MSDTDAKFVLIGLAGLSERTLRDWATEGSMPNLARICAGAAVGSLAPSRPSGATVAWSTLLTGRSMPHHRVFDRDYVAVAQSEIRHAGPERLAVPDLWGMVEGDSAAGGDSIARLAIPARPVASSRRSLVRGFVTPDRPDRDSRVIALTTGSVWKRRPKNVGEAEARAARQTTDLAAACTTMHAWGGSSDWRLLTVRFRCLSGFQRFLWPEIADDRTTPAGRPEWGAVVRGVKAALDDALGQIGEFAERRGAALLLVAENGIGPLRSMVNVNGILRIHGIQRPSAPVVRWARQAGSWISHSQRHATRRLFGEARHRRSDLRGGAGDYDWSRTLAFAPFGEDAGLIYLTPKARRHNQRSERVTLEIAEIFRLIADPATGEPIFTDVIPVGPRWDIDPAESGWPEIIAVPADGYVPASTWRFKEKARIFRYDPGHPGAVCEPGGFVYRNGKPAIEPRLRARIVDVVPTVLDHLGIAVPEPLEGMPLGRVAEKSIYQPHIRPDGVRSAASGEHSNHSYRFPIP